MKKMLDEFKAFAMRGNVLDLAVGVIIGGAFGKIVSSVVNDLIMPLIAYIMGGTSFADMGVVLRTEALKVKRIWSSPMENLSRAPLTS